MAVNITIIGLGQIGASIGLALSAHKDMLQVTGHDKKRELEQAALQKGVAHKMEHNLPSAVQNAKLVVLSIPVSQVRETLEIIAPDLAKGTVILDTSPIKAGVQQWASQILPGECYYVGLAPALNAECIHSFEVGLSAAREDLFSRAIFLVDASHNVPEEAVILAMDFVRLLGAEPILADLLESDGLMTKVHLLPQLAAAALLNSTIDQPGWRDARRLAGRPYAIATAGITDQDDLDSLKSSIAYDRTGITHALNLLIASLSSLRDDIQQQNDEGVATQLDAAFQSRKRWMGERLSADWENTGKKNISEIPPLSERLFGGFFTGKNRRK